MRFLSLPVMVLLLAACQSAPPSHGNVGSDAWLAYVDQRLSISDGQGHGPDYGSQEWCDAVHFKLHGQRPAAPTPCDQTWMQEVDAKLK